MSECFQNIFLLNDNQLKCEEFRSSLVYTGESIYEVIKIREGIPLFIEDHIARLKDTAAIRHKKLWLEAGEIKLRVKKLLDLNQIGFGNVKVVFNFQSGEDNHGNFLSYFIEHHYPDEKKYISGVPAILYHAVREYPSAKVINQNLRSAIFKKLIDTGAYEALLVNDEGFITEGSRSNVFFVKGNEIFSAPDGEVLSGIARKYILQVCETKNIVVNFIKVHCNQINDFHAAFISGTSPGMLPLYKIESVALEPDYDLIKIIRKGYQMIENKYISIY
jgi:branched-chain amino acid aminotransferase